MRQWALLLFLSVVLAIVNVLPWIEFRRQQSGPPVRTAPPIPIRRTILPPFLASLRDNIQPQRATNKGQNLLMGYNASRPGRVCPPLPGNVTVALEDDFEVGFKREILRNGSRIQGKSAFVMMVSNHKYVDGAIVMADSLKTHSQRVTRGETDIIILVSDKLQDSALIQLATVFDSVIVLYSVARFSPKSYYTTTFDKMYLFWLTQYEAVAFFDADTIAVGNPDDLLGPQFVPTEAGWVTAVGGDGYFQTALLILRPSRSTFIDIYLEYRFGPFNYDQWRARDGILLRTCLLPRHTDIDHPKSLHHFYGYIKPWFNKDAKYRHAKEPLDFDKYYTEWWDRYERLHLDYFVHLPLKTGENYGGHPAAVAVAQLRSRWGLPLDSALEPRDYMWLQRHSVGAEYLRPTKAKYAALRNFTVATLTVHSGITSCADVCRGQKKVCNAVLLGHTLVNDAAAIVAATGAGRCTDVKFSYSSPTASASPYLSDKGKCILNFLHDPASVPTCEALPPAHGRRVCGCVNEGVVSSINRPLT